MAHMFGCVYFHATITVSCAYGKFRRFCLADVTELPFLTSCNSMHYSETFTKCQHPPLMALCFSGLSNVMVAMPEELSSSRFTEPPV